MRPGKRLAVAAAMATALILSAGAALAAAAHATTNVNIRSGPGIDHHKVGRLHKGEKVDIAECQAGWCLITHDGPKGWVSAQYLSQHGETLTNTGPQQQPGGGPPPQRGGNPPPPPQ